MILLDSISKKELTTDDRQRLIIACQLANPKTREIYLKSFPSDYKTIRQNLQSSSRYFESIRDKLGYEPSWF